MGMRVGLARRAVGRGRAHPRHGRPLSPRPERSRSTAGRWRTIRAPEQQVRYGRRRCRALTDGGLNPVDLIGDWADRPVRFRGVPSNRVSNRVVNRGRLSTISLNIFIKQCIIREEWRRGWDSNPRYARAYNGFRDRPVQPLRHPSAVWRDHAAFIYAGAAPSATAAAATLRS